MYLKWLSILLAVVSSTVASSPLEANQACGDSVDCASDCEGGRYHIVNNNGTSFFGCKWPGIVRDYEVFECLMPYSTNGDGMFGGLVWSLEGEYYKEYSQKVCDAAAGELQWCLRKCLVTKDHFEDFVKSCREPKPVDKSEYDDENVPNTSPGDPVSNGRVLTYKDAQQEAARVCLTTDPTQPPPL